MDVAMPASYRPELGAAGRQDVEALLQHGYRWTRAAYDVVPPVAEQVAPALTVAAQLYEAEQYEAAIQQIAGAVRLVRQARQVYPALPEL
jgi:hypothetical protein